MEAKLKGEMGDLLYDASQKGDLGAAKRTISQLKASNPAYKPPFSSILRAATSKDRANVVKSCLDQSTPVTPEVMKIILINRTKDVLKILLDTNAIDVNYYIPWFDDMLSNAATHDDFEMANICLSHGADPNANLVEEHMSILAAVADLTSVGMARLLLEHGARLCGSGTVIKAAEAGKLEMVRVLLEEGADVNEAGIEHPTDPRYKEDMRTAVHRAVAEGHEEIVRSLLAHGAAISLKDPLGVRDERHWRWRWTKEMMLSTIYSRNKAGGGKIG